MVCEENYIEPGIYAAKFLGIQNSVKKRCFGFCQGEIYNIELSKEQYCYIITNVESDTEGYMICSSQAALRRYWDFANDKKI